MEDFADEPRLTAGDLIEVGVLVKAVFSFWDELKMLHSIGEVGFATLDARSLKSAVEELAGRSHEGAAEEVFLVSGLFANDHDFRIGWAFAHHGAGGGGMKRAGLAA